MMLGVWLLSMALAGLVVYQWALWRISQHDLWHHWPRKPRVRRERGWRDAERRQRG